MGNDLPDTQNWLGDYGVFITSQGETRTGACLSHPDNPDIFFLYVQRENIEGSHRTRSRNNAEWTGISYPEKKSYTDGASLADIQGHQGKNMTDHARYIDGRLSSIEQSLDRRLSDFQRWNEQAEARYEKRASESEARLERQRKEADERLETRRKEDKEHLDSALSEMRQDNKNTRITVITTAIASALAVVFGVSGLVYTIVSEQGSWARESIDRIDSHQDKLDASLQSIQHSLEQIQNRR